MSERASGRRAAFAIGLVSLLLLLAAPCLGAAVARSRVRRPARAGVKTDGHRRTARQPSCVSGKRRARARAVRCPTRVTSPAASPVASSAPISETPPAAPAAAPSGTPPWAPGAPNEPPTTSGSGVRAPEPTTPPPPPALPITGPSAWDEPSLSNPTTIQIVPGDDVLDLGQNRDYVLQCPSGTVQLTSALIVRGGRNVVFENCDLDLTVADWAAEFESQTGTLWIHDVHFGGSELTGGIQLQEPSATVVLRDVLFDQVNGSQNTNHAELIQTWSGPNRLLIDGLTGSTTYQGLFLLPDQYDSGPPPAVFDLRDIDIDDTQGGYAFWLGDVADAPPNDASGSILTWNVQDVYVMPNPARSWPGWWLYPQPSTGDPTWSNVLAGVPPGGSYVQPTPTGATGVDEGSSPPALVGEQP